MANKFKDYFGGLGFEVEGNSARASAYGKLDGYEINARLSAVDSIAPVQLHISLFATDGQKTDIQSRITGLNIVGLTQLGFTSYGLLLSLRDVWTVGRIIERLKTVLPQIVQILQECGALGLGCCPVCGSQSDNCRVFDIDGLSISLDPDCAIRLNAQIALSNEEFKNAPRSFGRGLLGALLGGLIGAAFAAILFYIGFISAWTAFIAVTLGAFFYTKFGGKRDKVMVITVAATSIVMMLATVLGYYIVASGMAFAGEGIEIGALDAFLYLMKDSEFAIMFYRDLALMLLFAVIGIVTQTVSLAKSVRRPGGIG